MLKKGNYIKISDKSGVIMVKILNILTKKKKTQPSSLCIGIVSIFRSKKKKKNKKKR